MSADDDIPAAYRGRPAKYTDATDLVAIGEDIYGRDAKLHPDAAVAWAKMCTAAEAAGVQLLVVSAFRSMARQAEIVGKKRARGLSWDEILRVSAYPGFSEHHTGCAVDIVSPECRELVEAFEHTNEFRWLTQHAPSFGFTLSYPRDNPHGVVYEPWHWRWRAAREEIPAGRERLIPPF
jgi:D-alanyl-D-alanine carboxypeptidase